MRHWYPVPVIAALLLAACEQQLVKDKLTNRAATVRMKSVIAGPFGVNNVVSHPKALDQSYRVQVTLAGIGWDREVFQWDTIQPKHTQWDWADCDRVVGRAREYGLQLLPVLDRCATWARRDPLTMTRDMAIQPPNPVHWQNYVRKIVQRYKDSVSFWEIWSRPDDFEYFAGRPDEYAKLLKVAYLAARETDPKCLVLMGSVADAAWLDSALTFGAGKYCDIISVNLSNAPLTTPDVDVNATTETREEPEISAVDTPASEAVGARYFDEAAELEKAEQKIIRFREVLAKHKIDKPLWATSSPALPAPARAQARLLVKFYAAALACGVDCIFWDKFVSEHDGSVSTGLLYPDLSRRFAAEAYAALTALLSDVTSCRIVSEEAGGLTAYEFTGYDESVLVVWGKEDSVVKLPAGFKQVHTMLGYLRPLTEEEEKTGELTVGNEPLFITTEIIEEPKEPSTVTEGLGPIETF